MAVSGGSKFISIYQSINNWKKLIYQKINKIHVNFKEQNYKEVKPLGFEPPGGGLQ